MTQKEKINIIIKKIQIVDEQLKYTRVLLDRLEDRLVALEENNGTNYREDREVIFESDWSPDDDEDSSDDE
jgi:hypothetical protein